MAVFRGVQEMSEIEDFVLYTVEKETQDNGLIIQYEVSKNEVSKVKFFTVYLV